MQIFVKLRNRGFLGKNPALVLLFGSKRKHHFKDSRGKLKIGWWSVCVGASPHRRWHIFHRTIEDTPLLSDTFGGFDEQLYSMRFWIKPSHPRITIGFRGVGS
jgi:hypothetical protein